MEMPESIRAQVRPGDWAVSIDLSDAYFLIPIIKVQEVPDILSQGNALAVQSSALRSLHCPMDFYQGYGGGEEDGCRARYYHAHVHRRLAHSGSVAGVGPQPARVGSRPLLQAGFEGEFPKVGPCTVSGLHLHRLPVCNPVTPGISTAEAHRHSGSVGGQFPGQSLPHSRLVAATARFAGIHGEVGSLGSLSHERHSEMSSDPVGLCQPVPSSSSACGLAGHTGPPVVVRSIDPSVGTSHSPPAVGHPGVHGQLDHGLGGPLPRSGSLRSVVSTGTSPAHQQPRAARGLQGSASLGEPRIEQGGVDSNGQYDRLELHQQTGGTRSHSLARTATEMLVYFFRRGVEIRAKHIAGKLNVLADSLSRQGQILHTEWSLSVPVFAQICQARGTPQVDLFATSLNTKLPCFVSPYPDPLAWDSDSLSLPWGGLWGYAFPPAPLIPLVLNKIRTEDCQILLVAPFRPRAAWYNQLLLGSIHSVPLFPS